MEVRLDDCPRPVCLLVSFYASGTVGFQSVAFLHEQHGHGFLPDYAGIPDHPDAESPQGEHRHLSDYGPHRLYHRHLQHVQLLRSPYGMAGIRAFAFGHHFPVLRHFEL